MKVDVELLKKLPGDLAVEFAENFCRKDFTESELAALQNRIGEVVAAEQPKGGRPVTHGKLSHKIDAVSRDRNGSRTDAVVGRMFGESRETVRKRREVVQSGDQKLIKTMNETGKVNGVHKLLKVKEKAEAINAEPPPLPNGPFRVLAIDPPWHYEVRTNDPTHRGSLPYPSMTIDEIKDLDVGGIAADDSLLWLWTTNAHLPEAFGILEAWGFQYKTMLTWGKHKMGLGDWLRGQTEHCLIGVKGKPVVTLTNETTLLIAKSGKHSAKPEEFYALVEKLCPGSKVELFQRRPREGWIGHGDEV
jgi:N6-adenosine-specific RNA methylase IME4